MMILRAKYVLPVSAPPIENGAVAVEGDTIVAVGRYGEVSGGKVRDLGEVVLAPGLINAHCHLDYTGMVGQVKWRGTFTDWIQQVVALKNQWTEAQYVESIREGLRQLLRTGTTSVVNIECFPSLMQPTPLRVWWCPELIDFNRGEVKPVPVEAAEWGLSPHAPYTVSRKLYRQATELARQAGVILTTHLAETTEEEEMFRLGTGVMYDYFRRAGRNMSDCRRMGPVQLLAEYGVLGSNCLAAHANCLTRQDIQLLVETGTHVVHCPKTHRYFGRGPSLLPALWAAGVNVCLGTDSLASNDQLDMFAEMQELARMQPSLKPAQVLAMATVNAAKALNRSGKLGTIASGAGADLIAVPLDGPVADPYAAVVFAEKPVTFVMIQGKAVKE